MAAFARKQVENIPRCWLLGGMAESLFDELKRYVGWSEEEEQTLRALHPVLAPHFKDMAHVFYQRILDHTEARAALEGGESVVGRLKVTLMAWMDRLLTGPWDEEYYEVRCRIGRVHVRIALPQHYMFGAMNVLREEMRAIVARELPETRWQTSMSAISKILDLELAIMLHTYREDLLSAQARTERLATFGQLVGSIGHELRNPLGVIETSLFILKNRVGEDERVHKHLGRIGEQLQISNSIITKLLDMIRDRPLMRERLNLGSLLDEVRAAVKLPEEVALLITLPASLPEIEGDPVQLRQVFVNLVENAVAAASPKGEVLVRGEFDDGRVKLHVEDTGPGVDPSIRRRLFEPLVTTRDKGIGLGLALVKRIVERHAGVISYAPRHGGGAHFTLNFPPAADPGA